MKPSQAAADYAEEINMPRLNSEQRKSLREISIISEQVQRDASIFDAGQSHHASIVNPVLREALGALEESRQRVKMMIESELGFKNFNIQAYDKINESIQSIKNILGDE